jgi:hypothetical protein
VALSPLPPVARFPAPLPAPEAAGVPAGPARPVGPVGPVGADPPSALGSGALEPGAAWPLKGEPPTAAFWPEPPRPCATTTADATAAANTTTTAMGRAFPARHRAGVGPPLSRGAGGVGVSTGLL